MKNVILCGVEVSTPRRSVTNEELANQFANPQEALKVMERWGRKVRYIADKQSENNITLAYEAAQKVIQNTKTSLEEIDLVIVQSQCPEYLWPTQALLLHDKLGLKRSCQVYDMNSNCLGMIIAVDNAVCALRSKSYHKALVIGVDCVSFASKPTEVYTAGMMGDAACAVILEAKESEQKQGFTDFEYCTVSDEANYTAKFPKYGLSNTINDPYINWVPINTSDAPAAARKQLDALCDKNHIQRKEIKLHCLSQFSKPYLESIMEALEPGENKAMYIGNQYGYTGGSSPFIALYEALNKGLLKKGDIVHLWTIAGFWTAGDTLLIL